ncbi:MAG: helix-turn-helix transcriptional regulator, partial [Coriobacteriales bacterium]|nr:helix-turn-helix transcriptional regulator [Coriobacteriales bacterium]
LERLLVPLIALVCMIIAFTGWPLAQLAAALLCAAIAAYYILHWNIQLIVSYKHHPNAVSLFSQAMIAPLEGLAFGLAVPLAFTLFGLSPLQWQLPGAMILLFGCALVPSITRYRSNKAMESLALSEAHGLEMLDTVISLDQMEGFTMLAAGGAQAGGNGAGQRSPGSWRSRSLAVCKQHGLSPREAEVFLLLAKGRNAEHIASDLYISIYTAKTHGYRIYRKLGINSQQELIDMVERCELP